MWNKKKANKISPETKWFSTSVTLVVAAPFSCSKRQPHTQTQWGKQLHLWSSQSTFIYFICRFHSFFVFFGDFTIDLSLPVSASFHPHNGFVCRNSSLRCMCVCACVGFKGIRLCLCIKVINFMNRALSIECKENFIFLFSTEWLCLRQWCSHMTTATNTHKRKKEARKEETVSPSNSIFIFYCMALYINLLKFLRITGSPFWMRLFTQCIF